MAPTRSYEWSAPTTSSVDSTPGTALSLSLFPSASGSSLWNPNGWTGHTDGHTARVEAVLPILGDRSRILATYSQPVDVDRIPRVDASDLVNGAALTVTPLVEVGLDADSLAALRAELATWTP